MSQYHVTVLGAGLAGCEAALWLAGKGVDVTLYEQKPTHFSPAHKSEGFAELICSNSLKAERLDSASGLLKEEMRRMGSQLLSAAEEARVAAGGALAVDRDAFSAAVTRRVEQCPNITVRRERVEQIDESTPILVATGPLTDGALADEIGRLTGDERLHFYDAVAPIVTAESLDYDRVFAASRYDRGEADYLNCPFNKAEYEAFHAALASAERAPLHDFDAGAEQGAAPDPDAHGKKADTVTVYEGCMPIEIMAARGADTMRFGPLRPVGLVDPNTGHRPWANVQLRAENKERTLYNIVGFQTNLKWGEQKRVFRMIPGLENAEFVRYGVMHRNTFLDAPRVLNAGLFLNEHPNVFFAGQITGFAGLVGAGRTETMRAVFGADKLDSGEIYVKGEKVHIRTPKDAIKRKIAFLTEDRKGQGLVLNLDVRTNLVLANMKGFSNGPFLDKDRIEQAGNDNVSALKIKTPSLNEVVGQLSGGNQQKVVIGKWVNTDADIFIFDEPTRGIDVGAKIEVYRVMNDLVKAGKCVIMVSSELPEILAMSDHVVVMRGGRVMADIDRDTPHFNSEDIMKAAWGGELD